MIDRLERSGHVERVRDTNDRRRVTVVETEAARKANHDAWWSVIEGIDEICRSLPAEHREAVVDVLSRITNLLEASGRN